MKGRMKTSRYDLYKMGCTCTTMVITKRCNGVNSERFLKNYQSSDFELQFIQMKVELLVIENKNVSVKCVS